MLTHLDPASALAVGLLIFALLMVVMFEATNGFHDAANAVATATNASVSAFIVYPPCPTAEDSRSQHRGDASIYACIGLWQSAIAKCR